MLEGNERREETPAHVALREAFVNCCVHADYSEESSLRISRYPSYLLFSNPGTMLISRRQYYEGGESICRNPSLQKMFMMIGAAEKAGSGASKIFQGWKSIGWKPPYPKEKSKPNKIELSMPLESLMDKRIEDALLERLGEERWYQLGLEERLILCNAYTDKVINHECIKATSSLHPADITHRLQRLVQEGYLTSYGHGRGTTYSLAFAERIRTKRGEGSEVKASNTAPRRAWRRSNETIASVLAYCTDWRSLDEIASHLDRKKEYVRNKILPKIKDHLERLHPLDSHPGQKYRKRNLEKGESQQ